MIGLRRAQRGDTIVEVLLAIAVVSGVLGGAYVSATKSLNNNRQAQERGEATKFVESQIERLKVAASDPTKGISSNDVFCIDTGINRIDFDSSMTDMPSLLADTPTIYPAACNGNSGVQYGLSIVRSGQTFTVRARWDGANGNNRDEVAIVYRLY